MFLTISPFEKSQSAIGCSFLFCVLTLGSSCTKEISYRYDYPGDQLAVIAQLSPQSGLVAYVYRSAPPQGEYLVEDLIVPDAEVRLFHEDSLIGMAQFTGLGRYSLPPSELITAGSSWRLEIEHPTLPSLTSEIVTIPPELIPNVTNLDYETNPGSNRQEAIYTFSAPDPAGENYYLFEAYPLAEERRLFQIRYNSSFDFQICEVNSYHPPHGLFFADYCFENQVFDLAVNIDIYRFPPGLNDFTEYAVRMRRIDENFWRYLNDKLDLDNESTVVEPRPTYSNMNGGYGVFMASTEVIRVYERP